MDAFLNRLFHLQPSLFATVTQDVMHLIVAVLILVIGWWISNRIAQLFASMLMRSHADPTLAPMLAGMAAWAVRVIAIVAALSEVGIATASVLAALGAAGLAIGLALQGTLQNIAAGIMLLMLRPFRAGDVIEGSGAAAGIVREVGLFTTRIERGDGNVVYVPNSQIWSNPVINYSSGGTQRVDVTIDLARRDQVDAAIGKLKEMVAAEPRVQTGTTLAPTVAVESYPSSGGVRLRLSAWVRDPDAPYAVDDLRGHARDALATAGLAVAGAAPARMAGNAALTRS
ncbi:mechanosensitive ion channel family protein [Paraburkholderia unamae]|uniref:Small-conductance mechanosensitive channel n=1 Tax=Paraburkholderia unamae TaxID=219649 RepID=A0ABX5KB57_9BURK|nr:mechanosensitive ion channel family protein [Paraburkholderia unamae]PVX72469.1 small-conductance mechanosensitive channel [Paraburkholderia unamae]RAR53609.1 small-conductance mechanosensitive channel [Paraburkholderia unamae]